MGMRSQLLTMIAVGIGLGLAIPNVRHVPPPAAIPATPTSPRQETILDRHGSGHFLAIADLNGEPTRFVVDTGADTIALTIDDARRARIVFDPAQFTVVGRGAGGEVRGQTVQIDSIVLDGKRVEHLGGVVLEGSSVSLLGQNYLRDVALEVRGDQMTLR